MGEIIRSLAALILTIDFLLFQISIFERFDALDDCMKVVTTEIAGIRNFVRCNYKCTKEEGEDAEG